MIVYLQDDIQNKKHSSAKLPGFLESDSWEMFPCTDHKGQDCTAKSLLGILWLFVLGNLGTEWHLDDRLQSELDYRVRLQGIVWLQKLE